MAAQKNPISSQRPFVVITAEGLSKNKTALGFALHLTWDVPIRKDIRLTDMSPVRASKLHNLFNIDKDNYCHESSENWKVEAKEDSRQ